VDELSRVFKVTPANIRHHLSILVDQGSLDISGVKTTGIKGRPVQIFSSAVKNRLNNLENLTDILLDNYLHTIDHGDNTLALQKLASHLAARYPLDENNPTRRMYACMRVLNSMHYQAHWEAHIENPRIFFDHCPYQSISEHHPEICQMDEFLLADLLNAPVKQVERQTGSPRGLLHCVFTVSSRAA
jgi:predicted ArsR family transcriptional regulator